VLSAAGGFLARAVVVVMRAVSRGARTRATEGMGATNRRPCAYLTTTTAPAPSLEMRAHSSTLLAQNHRSQRRQIWTTSHAKSLSKHTPAQDRRVADRQSALTGAMANATPDTPCGSPSRTGRPSASRVVSRAECVTALLSTPRPGPSPLALRSPAPTHP